MPTQEGASLPASCPLLLSGSHLQTEGALHGPGRLREAVYGPALPPTSSAYGMFPQGASPSCFTEGSFQALASSKGDREVSFALVLPRTLKQGSGLLSCSGKRRWAELSEDPGTGSLGPSPQPAALVPLGRASLGLGHSASQPRSTLRGD